MRRILPAAAAAAAVALLIFGIVRGASTPESSAPPSDSSQAAAPVTAAPAEDPSSSSAASTPAPSTRTPTSTTTYYPEGQPPAAGADVTAAAEATATGFVQAWLATTGVTPEQWLQGMAPYTTGAFLDRLATADPANVPGRSVTGPATAVNVDEQFASVRVPTDGGDVVVLLAAVPPAWQVTGIEPAGEQP